MSREELAQLAARGPAPTEEELMKKLDPRLVTLVMDMEKAAREVRETNAGARASSPAEPPCIDAQLEVMVWFTGDADDLVAAGLKLEWRDRNDRGFWYATGQIAPSRLAELVAIEHVVSIEPTNKMTPELSDSVPAIGVRALRLANADATGAGVVVAIIDSGFDWTHGSFRDATGRTRLLAIWDFHLPGNSPVAGEIGFQARDPADPTRRLDASGVYYDRDDINFSLGYEVTKASPVRVRTRDPERPFDPKQPDLRHGHGTHVGGIAAGDGSPVPCCRPWGAGRYEGVAPGAEIIAIRGDSTDAQLPRSLSFIDEIAGDKPVVVNVSAGINSGPHDGTTPAEKAIDWFVSLPNGRVFVKSAGNEGNTGKHGRLTVPPQAAGPPPVPGIAELDVIVPAGMNESDTMELWYSQQGSLELQITPHGAAPGPSWLGQEGNRQFAIDPDDPQMRVIAAATAQRPENGDRRILLLAPKHPGQSELTFTMRFRNAGAGPVVVDGWISKGAKGLTFASPTVEGTLTTPGTALHAIAVANHRLPSSSCGSGGGIHESSSRGPVRVVPADPAQAPLYAKPTLAAPGTGITSAKPSAGCRCCPEWLQDHYQPLSGTSMAAPHVAGVIALMLQKNKTLTSAQIRALLEANTTPVEGPPNEWGAGKLDAQRAWEAVPAPAPVTPLAPAPTARAAAGAADAHQAAAPRAPTAAPPAPVTPSMLHPALQALRELMHRAPEGELCAALVSRHFSEVRRLINNNVKVAAMWHRADGPRMLRRLAVGTVEADAPAPLRDHRDRAYLVRMLEQLHRHGSPLLRASIDRHQALLLRMLEAPLAAQFAPA